jgi:tetratricopeptide (TPR) repeat protein
MPNNVIAIKKDRFDTLKFDVYCLFVMTFIMMVFGLLGSATYLALITGQWLHFGIGGALLLYAVWAFGASFVSIPMTMLLNRKYGQKKYAELDIAHSRALGVLARVPFRKSADVPALMSNLALMRLCQGDYKSAEELFRQAVEYIAKNKQLNTSFAAGVLHNNLACACVRLGNLAEAEEEAKKAIAIFELPKNKAWKITMALPYCVIGTVHAKFGEYDTAEQHLHDAQRVFDTEKMPAAAITTSFVQGKNQVLLWLSYVCLKQGKVEEATGYCDNALVQMQQDPRGTNTLTLEILLLAANEFMNAKHFERAEKLLDVAYGVALESPFHPDAKQTLNYYEKLLLLTDRKGEVDDMRRWLRHAGGIVPI